MSPYPTRFYWAGVDTYLDYIISWYRTIVIHFHLCSPYGWAAGQAE